MFDAQKLLGQLLREAAGGGLGGSRRHRGRGSLTGLPRGLEAKVGMGLLGLAIAAFEHFRQSSAASAQAPAHAPPYPGMNGGPGQAPQPMTASSGLPATPPPPPPGRPVPEPQAAGEGEQLRSLHLLRAMIAAAHADGLIDEGERTSLLTHARESGLGDEDLAALEREMRTPLSTEQLILQTPTELREETYIAALVAIDADHPDEDAFLASLCAGLQLDAAAQSRIKHQLGLTA